MTKTEFECWFYLHLCRFIPSSNIVYFQNIIWEKSFTKFCIGGAFIWRILFFTFKFASWRPLVVVFINFYLNFNLPEKGKRVPSVETRAPKCLFTIRPTLFRLKYTYRWAGLRRWSPVFEWMNSSETDVWYRKYHLLKNVSHLYDSMFPTRFHKGIWWHIHG